MSGKKLNESASSNTKSQLGSRPSSSEVIKEAKRWCALKSIKTKRPITPRNATRTLYGYAASRGSRPPSSYSVGAQSFDPMDDSLRPSSISSMRKSKLAPLPHTPCVPVDRDLLILPTNKQTEPSPSSVSKLIEDVSKSESSNVSGLKAVRDRISGGKKEDETPDEALYWNSYVLPLLESLEGFLNEKNDDKTINSMCQACQSLFNVLTTGSCFIFMKPRRRTSLLSSMFRLLNSQSRELHVLSAKIILEMKVRNKNLTNICKLVFTICREGKNDQLFLKHNVLSSLLSIFKNSKDVLTNYEKYEAFVYLTGSLKCLSDNEQIVKILFNYNFLQTVVDFITEVHNDLTLCGEAKKPRKYAESLLVQVCSAFCNVLNADVQMQQTVNYLPLLMMIFQSFIDDHEIVAILSRIFSKISMFRCTFPAFYLQKDWPSLLLSAMSKHYKHADVCIHLALVLGDLTSENDEARSNVFASDTLSPNSLNCVDLLVKTIKHYSDTGSSSQNKHFDNSASTQATDALVKMVRFFAHLTINQRIGLSIAANEQCATFLLAMLKTYTVETDEELLINVLTTLNNLSYYSHENNVVLKNRLSLAVLLCDFITADTMNCVSEVMRVFGNLTKFEDVRSFLHQHKVSYMMVALLDSGERLVVYHACGVLVNMSADRRTRADIIAEKCTEKLIDVIRDFSLTEWRIGGIACQLLWNLSFDPAFNPPPSFLEVLEKFLTYKIIDEELQKVAEDEENLKYLRMTWKEEFYEFAFPLLKRMKSGHFNLIPIDRPIDNDEFLL